MSDSEILEMVFVLNPRTGERARRLMYAVQLLREGKTTRDVSAILRERYKVSRFTAWEIVDVANDLAGSVQDKKDKP